MELRALHPGACLFRRLAGERPGRSQGLGMGLGIEATRCLVGCSGGAAA